MGWKLKEKIAQDQLTLIRAARIMHDLFQITAAQIKLAKVGEQLPAKERGDLKDGIQLAKVRVDRELKFVNMKGNPEERILVKAGERAIEADKEVRRPNRQETHRDFLHERADAFHAKLARDAAKGKKAE